MFSVTNCQIQWIIEKERERELSTLAIQRVVDRLLSNIVLFI